MSRLAKKPLTVPANVTVTVAGSSVTVKGPKHQLSLNTKPQVKVNFDAAAKQIKVDRVDDSKAAKALHGTTWALLRNMLQGVTAGYKKELEVNGVGWTAVVQGRNLVLSVGYADKRTLTIPQGVDVAVNQNRIVVSGPDLQAVGQFAAQTRAQRKPEPYNAKGIKYVDEVIIRKEGKAVTGAGK